MRKIVFVAAIIMVIGVLVAVAPWTFAPVCEVHTAENPNGLFITTSTGKLMPMPCGYTARAEIGVGAVVVIFGGLMAALFAVGNRLLFGIVGLSLAGAIAIMPTELTGMCANSAHGCRTLTEPLLIMMAVVLGIISLALIFYRPKEK
jgi:hypothetical protein